MELQGKKILISGGGSGIGLELAARLTEANDDVPKIPASAVVDAIVGGIARDREEIRVARVKQLALLARVAPRLADRILTRALGPAQAGSPS